MPDPDLVPVDHNPFEPYTLQPVDHDPFSALAAVAKSGQTVQPVNARPMTGQAALSAAGIPDISTMTPEEQQGFALTSLAGAFVPPAAKGAARVGETLAEAAAPEVKAGIRAFHGSPHDFNQFDLSKIGTGEGAQSYGHGLYFAENPKVAESYKPDITQTAAGDLSKDFPHLQGKTYEVNINADPAHFLDWDKPLSEQHPKVQEAIADKAQSDDRFGRAVAANYNGQQLHTLLSGYPEKRTGASQSDATQILQEAGIPGIKYLDQGSRNAGGWHITPPDQTVSGKWMVKSSDYNSQGMHFDTQDEAQRALQQKIGSQTSNYVVFNDKLIDIIKKYGMAGLVAGGAAHFKTQPVDHNPFQ